MSYDHDDECYSCGEDFPGNECPNSQRPCGHHCNCSWCSDECCWCGKEFGEEEKVENLLNSLLPTLERIELHLYNISEHLLAMRRL